MEEGYSKGEICNRDGCQGIIDEHDSDGGCSCHINPPCSYCETSREYCPLCEWDGGEEQAECNKIDPSNYYKGFGSKAMHDEYYRQKAIQDEQDRIFNDYFSGKVKAEDIIYRKYSHSNSSMKVKGVFPEGTTREQIVEKVRGTFGGRFESLTNHSFIYIAYTD